MSQNLRQRAEILFRRGNERVESGSEGTEWAVSLDIMVRLLKPNEELIHISGFTNFGVRKHPATLLTLTTTRLIVQLYPAGDVFELPLETIQEVSCHKDFFLQNWFLLTTKSENKFDFAIERDIAAPLERAIKSTLHGTA